MIFLVISVIVIVALIVLYEAPAKNAKPQQLPKQQSSQDVDKEFEEVFFTDASDLDL